MKKDKVASKLEAIDTAIHQIYIKIDRAWSEVEVDAIRRNLNSLKKEKQRLLKRSRSSW